MHDGMSAETWQARAALFELMALSFRYPDIMLAEVVANGEWADAANEIAALVGVDWTAGEVVGDSGAVEDADRLLHALRGEATRLFIGAPDPVVSPYEGVWRAMDDGADALLFVNPHSMEVERFCKACGLGRPEGTNEPLDYVATELELLEYLASRAAIDAAGCSDASASAKSGAADGFASVMVESADLPGDSAEAAFDRFMTTHIQQWMPRFAEKVQEESKHAFFNEAARLMEQTLKMLV